MTETPSDFVLAGLTLADDMPHEVPDVPDWSENYLSFASFTSEGMSHWLHHGRTNWDPHLWQEIVVVYLPDDRYLVSKATARSRSVLPMRRAISSMDQDVSRRRPVGDR
jgi:hypothetical protein